MELIKFPGEIRYVVTNRCPYTCYYCHTEGMPGPLYGQEELDAEDYAFFFKIGTQLGVRTISISGGEPLVRDDISDIVSALKKKSAFIEITTNAYLVDRHKSIWKDVDEVHVSIDSLDEKVYKNITRVKGSYRKAIDGIKFLSSQDFKFFKLNSCSIRGLNTNLGQIKQYIEFARRVNAIPRYIELFPEELEGFISHEELSDVLNKIGYKEIRRQQRKIVLQKSNNLIELIYIFCTLALKQKNPESYCYNNNDVFLTPNGVLKYCMLRDRSIDVLKEIKDRNGNRLLTKIRRSFEKLGKDCPLKRKI